MPRFIPSEIVSLEYVPKAKAILEQCYTISGMTLVFDQEFIVFGYVSSQIT